MAYLSKLKYLRINPRLSEVSAKHTKGEGLLVAITFFVLLRVDGKGIT